MIGTPDEMHIRRTWSAAWKNFNVPIHILIVIAYRNTFLEHNETLLSEKYFSFEIADLKIQSKVQLLKPESLVRLHIPCGLERVVGSAEFTLATRSLGEPHWFPDECIFLIDLRR
jgi:hypothetical protein